MGCVSTIGIFAHANAGKTTVSEGLLFNAGKIKSVGRVDYGNTVTDDLEIERNRGITVRSSYVSFDIGDKQIQLLDTPGHIDFSAEVERAVAVLDGAVLVVSGVDGVQPQTIAIWKMLSERHIPTIIFINKLDRDGSDIDKTVEGIKKRLSKNVCLLNRYDSTTKSTNPVHLDHDALLDLLSNYDDEVLEKYLSNQQMSDEYLMQRFARLSKSGHVFPILTGCALNNIGIKELINGISSWLPEYQDEHVEFSSIVYSVKYDNKWSTYLKVLSGKLEIGSEIPLNDTEPPLKIRQILRADGGDIKSVKCAAPGDLVILPSVYIPVGTIVGTDYNKIAPLSYVNPLFAISLNSKDPKRLSDALTILNKEDPYLNCCYNATTKNFTIDVIGELQGEVVAALLKSRFGIDDVRLSDSSIIYKETPVKPGCGKAGYRKCSNVGIGIKPLERGSGLKFISMFSTDFLFAKYQKQIERLLMQRYVKSGLFGWELTDAEVSIIDGKCDHVGSEPLHYNIAGPIAFMRALQEAETKLLEPLMMFEMTCAPEKLSQVMSVLTKQYNTTVETTLDSNTLYIKGTAPLSFSKNLPRVFASMLGGAFSFVQREIGYIDAAPGTVCTKASNFISPLNTEQFVSSQNGSMTLLDKGLGERGGKPKFPRRNNFIKKREALAIKRKQLPPNNSHQR